MGFFSVTKDLVRKLLSLIDSGLEGTAGEQEQATFCVQQAISLATGDPGADDQPKHCVMPWLINLGICLNDADSWENDHSRAEGLREFAVAELGSSGLREKSFKRMFLEKFNAKWPENALDELASPDDFVAVADCEGEKGLKTLAKMVVEILQEMNSPGTEYLFMANKKAYEKPEGFGPVPRIKPATEEQRKAAWIADDAPWEDPKPVSKQ